MSPFKLRSHSAFVPHHPLQARDPSIDNIIVFGPDGQASITAPQEAGNDPPVDSSMIPAPVSNPQDEPADALPQETLSNLPKTASESSPSSPTPQGLSVFSSIAATTAVTLGPSSMSSLSLSSTLPSLSTSAISSNVITSSQASSVQAIAISSTTTSSPASSETSIGQSVTATTQIQSAASVTSVAAASVSTSSHEAPFYIAIVLGALAAVAVIAAFVAWLFRMRSRSRIRSMETIWPWDTGDNEKEDGMAFGFGSPNLVDPWEHEIGGPMRNLDSHKPGLNQGPQYPSGIHLKGNHFVDTYGGNRGGAYVDDPYGSNSSPLPPSVMSAPELGARGPLQIANMMPGDVFSSGDESSRPGTVLGMLRIPSKDDLGTPRERVLGDRPRFLALGDGGLDVPWTHANQESRQSGRNRQADDLEKGTAQKEELDDHWEPLPFPGEGQPAHTDGGATSDQVAEGWTASLRSNLANVLSTVSGGYLSSSTTDQTASDKFTSVPQRIKRKSQRRSKVGRKQGEGSLLTRESTTVSSLWTLEETEEGAGVVHIRGADMQTSASPLPLNITKKPPAVMVRSRQRLYEPSSGTVSRASSVYSTASATSSMYDRGSVAPRLPSLPPLSRDITMGARNGDSSADEAAPGGQSLFRSEEKQQPRPKVMTRLSSSDCSTASCGSGTSSVSGSEERLTDEEKMAQQVLRERRKKVMGMGRGKPVGSRLGSFRSKVGSGSRKGRK